MKECIDIQNEERMQNERMYRYTEWRKTAEGKVLNCFNFPPDQEIFKGEYRGVVLMVLKGGVL